MSPTYNCICKWNYQWFSVAHFIRENKYSTGKVVNEIGAGYPESTFKLSLIFYLKPKLANQSFYISHFRILYFYPKLVSRSIRGMFLPDRVTQSAQSTL